MSGVGKGSPPGDDYPEQMDRDDHYRRLAGLYGGAIARLARATEADPARREELAQDIHTELWRSLSGFDGRCSERTWVFRVAHNVAASHVARARRRERPTAPLHEIEAADPRSLHAGLERRSAVARLHALAQALPEADRQVLLLALEGLKPGEIAEVTGLTPNAVSIRLTRLRKEVRVE